MELCAVLEGLKVIAEMNQGEKPRVQVFSDSQYLTKAFNDNWLGGWQRNGWRTSQKKAVLNQDLWQQLLEQTKNVDASFTWVKGHAGNPLNEEADRLAVAESECARASQGYQVNVGTPRSVAEGCHNQAPQARSQPEAGAQSETPAASPSPQAGPTAEALMNALVDEAIRADSFADFQKRMLQLKRELAQ